MEPKNPIVIDGVDVSGCEYCLKMTKCRCTIQQDVYKCLCEENPNCYYKQLQRKEQDYEKVKQTLDIIKEIAENREIFCENCSSGVESFTCDDCGYVKILQKISEVLDE